MAKKSKKKGKGGEDANNPWNGLKGKTPGFIVVQKNNRLNVIRTPSPDQIRRLRSKDWQVRHVSDQPAPANAVPDDVRDNILSTLAAMSG